MKKQIEELFKESLENHELPFNENAWTSMNARLNAVKPVHGKGKGGNLLKYIAVATGVTIISVATYLYVSSLNEINPVNFKVESHIKEVSSPDTPSSSQTQPSVQTSDQEATATTDVNTAASLSSVHTISRVQSSTPENQSSSSVDGTENSSTSTIDGKPFGSFDGTSEINSDGIKPIEFHQASKNGIPDPNLTPVNEMILPVITGKCIGEEFEVNNVNKRYLVILDASGNRMRIPSESKHTFSIDQVGDYTYGFFVNGKFNEKGRFTVSAKPSVNLDLDSDTKYEAGLPTIVAHASGSAESYTWKSEGQTVVGRKADFHYFKGGNHTIKLTATNGSCSVEKETTVYSENYNLMAVNAFDPSASDPRNNTFMPYALTQRKTNFHLIILDSRTGELVYETTDADRPWDGTDRRTGKIDETATIYIWKVIIENPEPGERGEYKGSIMKM